MKQSTKPRKPKFKFIINEKYLSINGEHKFGAKFTDEQLKEFKQNLIYSGLIYGAIHDAIRTTVEYIKLLEKNEGAESHKPYFVVSIKGSNFKRYFRTKTDAKKYAHFKQPQLVSSYGFKIEKVK